jgi:hypothetical protein
MNYLNEFTDNDSDENVNTLISKNSNFIKAAKYLDRKKYKDMDLNLVARLINMLNEK